MIYPFTAIVGAAALAGSMPAHAAFDPIAFFRGHSTGTGELKVIFSDPTTVRVKSVGYNGKDGTFVLKQDVSEGSKPVRTRYWTIRKLASGRYTGTLSDAVGPVEIAAQGNAISIRYTDKDGLKFEQVLQPVDARTVDNQLKVRRFGIVVARLHETIRKLD